MDNEKTAGSNLTVIAEYSETAAALADLRERHQGVVYDVTVSKEMKAAKEARAELRTLRTGLEKKRVEIKAPALERCRLIDAEARRITAELVALEEPIDVQIKAEEARAETARLEKLEAERLRVEAIQQKIQQIRDVPASLVGKPSVIIAGQLAKLRETVLDEDELGADYVTATDALTAAIARVTDLLVAQQAFDDEERKIRAERAELERIRAENERLQREERDRIAAEETAARAAEQAEAERLAAIERGKQQAAAAAERERLAAERRELEAQQQAERERQAAEQRKLDEQAAQLKRERQAAAAKAEADRLANLGLREAASAVLSWLTVNGHSQQQVTKDLMAALENDAADAKPARVKRSAVA